VVTATGDPAPGYSTSRPWARCWAKWAGWWSPG